MAKGLDENVDGVVSVDPVAMSFILGGTGPVTLSDGAVLTQENAVEVLLSAVYRSYPDAKRQDDTFERAARTIFDVVKSGRGESRLAIAGMVRAAKENRLMVWSSRKDEQRLIGPSALSGALSRNDGPTPHVGLYLNDAASTKMEYYLDYATRVTTGRCLDGDVQELFTTTQITSTAPANAADLPQRHGKRPRGEAGRDPHRDDRHDLGTWSGRRRGLLDHTGGQQHTERRRDTLCLRLSLT